MCVKLIEILSHEGSLRGAKSSVVNYYMHWFRGDWDMARQLLHKGYHRISARMHRKSDLLI